MTVIVHDYMGRQELAVPRDLVHILPLSAPDQNILPVVIRHMYCDFMIDRFVDRWL